MKTAVLIYGEFREFEIAHKSWGFLEHFPYDIYVSTWNVSKFDSDILDIHFEEEVTENMILKYFPEAVVNISPVPELPKNNGNKLIMHWKRLLEIVNSSGIIYDKIILTRTDIYLKYDYNLLELPGKFYGFGGVHQQYDGRISVMDIFFYGDVNVILPMIDGLTYMDDDTCVVIHQHLAEYIIDNKIYMDSLPSCDNFIYRYLRRFVSDFNLSLLEERALAEEIGCIQNHNTDDFSVYPITFMKLLFKKNMEFVTKKNNKPII